MPRVPFPGGCHCPSSAVDMTSARPERPVGELLGDLARLYLGAWAACERRAWTDGILPDPGSQYGVYDFCTSVGFAA